jgi:FG-GAP-like repeat
VNSLQSAAAAVFRRGITSKLHVAVMLASACLLPGSPRDASASDGFGPKVDYLCGSAPNQVATGDLNADGKLDLAVANTTSPGAVSILLGDGAGGFGTDVAFVTADGPSSVAIGDLDFDGRPDLAVTNHLSASVSVLINNTAAGATTPSFTRLFPDYETGNGPNEVAIGDVNRDGKPDLVTVNSFSGTVSVLINTTPFGGPPAFLRLTPDAEAASGPTSIAMGDIDRDGMLDLAVANHLSSDVSVLLGNGDGTFAPHTEFPIGAESYSVAIGDLNRDGKLDLATASYATSSVSVLIGNGDGTFAAKNDIAVGGPSIAVAIGDVNQDGKPDLAVTHDVPVVSVLLGAGNGTFGSNADFATGDVPTWVAIADVDMEGRPDLVVANSSGTSVSVLINHLSQETEPLNFENRAPPVGAESLPIAVAIGDLNRDGKPDLTVGNVQSAFVSVLLGDGEGVFAPYSDFATGGNSYSVAIGDLNRDGKPDVVTANGLANTLSVLPGNGDGTFGPFGDVPVGSYANAVLIADLNRDGAPDVAVANEFSGTVSVLLGNGDGTFGPGNTFETGAAPFAIAVGDLNCDGKLDLATANLESHTVSVLLGNGDGTFAPKDDFATGFEPASVAIGDLNADGRPDLAAANSNSKSLSYTLSVLLNTTPPGTTPATFSPHSELPSERTYSVAIGDLNGDGKLDLATANLNPSISVLLGAGDGTFAPPSDFPGWSCFKTVAIGDLNRDGKPDLAAPTFGGDVVSVHLNLTPTVSAPVESMVSEFVLGPMAPNPSPGEVHIPFAVPRETRVRVAVLDVLGRSVAVLADGVLPAGRHQVTWSGAKGNGQAPAGIYFVCYTGGGKTSVRRFVIAR